MDGLTQAEITCAVTDLFNGIVMIPLIWMIKRQKTEKTVDKSWWLILMSLITVSTFGGFVVHYFFVKELSFKIAWIPLYILLFITMNTFFFFALYLNGRKHEKILHGIVTLLTVLFLIYIEYAEFVLWTNPIRVFIIYTFVVVLAGFGIFAFLAFGKKKKSAQLFMLSFVPLLIGGIFQLKRNMLYHFIWDFNEDGITHFLITVSLVIICLSARKQLEE